MSENYSVAALERPLLAVFFGHHKAATTFLAQLLDDFCAALGRRHAAVANPAWINLDLAGFVAQQRLDCLSFVNADARLISCLPPYRAIHVIRDPRDMAVSAYFSHRYSHSVARWPELVEHRRRLDTLDFEAGLLLDFEFTDKLVTDGYALGVFHKMRDWDYNRAGVLELRYEDVFADIETEIFKALIHLGLLESGDSTTTCRLRALLQVRSFEDATGGRPRGTEDIMHHYRMGAVGDWRRYFSERHKVWFKEHYDDFLMARGYEIGRDW